jgi:hypothetical protein
MLGVCHQRSNVVLSEGYFQRARQVVWSSHAADPPLPSVSALSVSEHFAKWHYLNFHQHITDGFRDAGRQHPAFSPDRETIQIYESHPGIKRCVTEAQQLMAQISGKPPLQPVYLLIGCVLCPAVPGLISG